MNNDKKSKNKMKNIGENEKDLIIKYYGENEKMK